MWMISHLNYVWLKFTLKLSKTGFWIVNRTDPQRIAGAEQLGVILACAPPTQLYEQPWVQDTSLLT